MMHMHASFFRLFVDRLARVFTSRVAKDVSLAAVALSLAGCAADPSEDVYSCEAFPPRVLTATDVVGTQAFEKALRDEGLQGIFVQAMSDEDLAHEKYRPAIPNEIFVEDCGSPTICFHEQIWAQRAKLSHCLGDGSGK